MDNRKDSNTSCTSYTSSSDWSPLSPLGSKSNRITGQDVVDPELTFGPMPQTHEEAEKLFDQLTLSLHDLSNTKTEYQTEMSSRSSSYDTNMLDTPSQSPLEQGEIVNDKSKDQDRDIDIEAQIDACLSRLDQARKDIEYYTQRLEKRLKQRQKKDRKERLRQKAHRRRERRQRRQAQQIKSHLDGLSLDPALSNLRLVPNTILSPKSKPISISKSKITKHRPKKSKIHPDFHLKIMQMARPLHPLVSYSSGLTHPFFPKTLLSYNLLTSAQLDQLALHFHQVYPPTDESFRYPLPVKPWITTNGIPTIVILRKVKLGMRMIL
ncbi:hypothetical protein BDV18DRAFT_47583 [Aspergillus unguis]